MHYSPNDILRSFRMPIPSWERLQSTKAIYEEAMKKAEKEIKEAKKTLKRLKDLKC